MSLRRVLVAVPLAGFPAALTALVVRIGLEQGNLGIDFLPLRRAARDLFEGRSPWPTPEQLPALLETGTAYVYPPLAALITVPLTLAPATAAVVAWTAVLVGATLLALRLLGVRDWRCYGAAFLWGCVVSAVQTGNVTLLLVLGLAAVWRWRRNAAATAAIVGVLIALKFFLWPLAVWLTATRRPRAALGALAVGLAVTAVTWSVIGFEGLTGYPALLRALHRIEESESYTVLALGLQLGLPHPLAATAGLLLAGALLLASVVLARRGGEARAFSLAIAAAVAFSTVVWLHYFALLLVPVAILRPRFGPIWMVPLAFWLGTGTGNGTVVETALVLLAAGVTLAAALRSAAASPGIPWLRDRPLAGSPR